MKIKIKSWIKRYLPAEILSMIATLIIGRLTDSIFHNRALTALAGTWSNNITYYGIIISSDLIKQREKNKKISIVIIIRLVRNMILEFGPAEYLDSFLLRPFWMYICPLLLNNLSLGLIIGTLMADITFYLPTIISYELRKKILGE